MKKIIKYLIIIITSISLISIMFIINTLFFSDKPVNTDVNFNITYDDPGGDVKFISDEEYLVTGYDDIDIQQIKSYKSNDNRYLFLELKVVGKIKNSQDIQYEIYLEDDDKEYYVSYQNGICDGYNPNSDSDVMDFLKAKIKNSNTLKITVPLQRLKDYSDFDFEAYVYKDLEKEDYYEDSCPENSWSYEVIIESPLDGSVVLENCSIMGITYHYANFTYKSVEVQIYPVTSTNWELAITFDNWSNWSYNWNTEKVINGQYKIFVRAFDDKEYYYDKITLYVEDENVIRNQITDLPTYHIGDYYYYHQIEGGTERSEIIGFDNININGTDYEVYIWESNFESEYIDDSNYYKVTFNSKYWTRFSDLKIVKEEIDYNIINNDEYGKFNSNGNMISTNEFQNFGTRYPLKVGNKWVQTIKSSNIGFSNTSTGKNEIENFTEINTIYYECLRTDTITVPAGTFEVFIIYSKLNNSKVYWYEDGVINQSENNWEEFGYNYNLEYYSPDIGYLVKTEMYYDNREISDSLVLFSYKYGNKSYKQSTNRNSEFPTIYIISSISLITISSLILITGTEIGKYSFFNALAPFYAKRKKKRNYKFGYIKGSVRGVIFANPGENYSTIKRILDLSNGTLTYYLKALEKEGIIRSERDGFLRRFYPAKGKLDAEVLELTKIQKDIHEIIKNHPGIYQKDIQSKLDISQQKLNYHIQLMVDARVIKAIKESNKSKYFILDEVS